MAKSKNPPATNTSGIDLAIVTLVFDARSDNPAAPDRLLAVLSKYVVMSRQYQGCRNIDLCASVTAPNRYLIVEKWETPDHQRAHFDSEDMIEMARSCEGLLERRPDIDLYEGISAHDLR
jgi:quinol monooxygenase YgiN